MLDLGKFLKKSDRFLWPVGCFAGVLISRLGYWTKLAFGKKTSSASIPSVLVLRPGGMGDLVLTTLALKDLGHSADSIFWLIEKRSEGWAKHLGLRYLCYDRGFLSALIKISAKFDLVINTEQRFGLSQAFAIAACRPGARLICFSTNRAAKLAGGLEPYDPYDTHEYESFWKLLKRGLGEGKNAIFSLKKNRQIPPSTYPVVSIAGSQSKSRSFSQEFWKSWIQNTTSSDKFFLSAAPIDRKFQKELAVQFSGQAEDFSGDFSFLCDTIAKAPRLVTVDGGMVHVASYYGVPVSVIFTAGRSKKWAPMSEGSSTVMTSGLPCQSCTLFGQVPRCPNRYACKNIPIDSLRST